MINKLLTTDMALLIMRIYGGLFMLVFHGIPKLQSFSAYSTRFSDPIGIGSYASLVLVIFAEVLCAAMVLIGASIRITVIPLIIVMGVAVFVIHSGDPMSTKELAVSYLFCYLALFIGGAGKYNLCLHQYLKKRSHN